MAAITASMVGELRAKTDAPMMECKKALTEAEGNMEKAEELLRIKLGNKAGKASGRITAEGVVTAFVDGNVGGRQDKERLPDRPNQVGKGLWRHNRRRSAAKVNVVNLDTPPDLPGYQIDFTTQGRSVCGDWLISANDRGVAATIPAHRPAERNVKIE